MAKRVLDRLSLIERSIIKNYRKELWAPFVRAIDDFNLIKPGDKIAVCISGGKDSFIMAKLFQELHRHTNIPFDLTFIVMNPGYNKINLELIKENLSILNIDAKIVESNIFEVANAQDNNPCYLCARMRRGYLYKMAQSFGCNKIALGHHYDDVIETTLMNMLNSGSFQTMLPKLKSTNFVGMELIRPLYYVREKDIIKWAKFNELNFIQCACKFTDESSKKIVSSQRKATKDLIESLLSYNPLVEQNIFMSALNVNMNMILGYKKDGIEHSYLEEYDSEELKTND